MELLGHSRGDEPGYLAIGIVLSAENPGAKDASRDAGGIVAGVDIVKAQPALVGDSPFFVKDPGLVGAGEFTIATAYTFLLFDGDYTIIQVIGCSSRADAFAGGIGTVLALDRHENGTFWLALGQDVDVAQPVR
jgi:hypothetical protein